MNNPFVQGLMPKSVSLSYFLAFETHPYMSHSQLYTFFLSLMTGRFLEYVNSTYFEGSLDFSTKDSLKSSMYHKGFVGNSI